MSPFVRSAVAAACFAGSVMPVLAAGPNGQPSAPAPAARPVAPQPAAPAAAPLQAQPPAAPKGVWIDHTGRGAVEITDCNGRLCGQIVWLKDAKNIKGCGIQVLANVPPAGPGTWDGGWIYDPEQDSKYDVEVKVLSPDRLKITGYLGAKFLGETFTWVRAPLDIVRCKRS